MNIVFKKLHVLPLHIVQTIELPVWHTIQIKGFNLYSL